MANLPQFQKNLKTLKEVLRIKLLNIKTDYVFKRVFGHIGNEDITKNFLSCILRQEVSNIELEKNTILEKDLIDDKIGILDIKAEINNNTNVDIEMQIIDKKNSAQRILFYCAKLFTKSLKSGKDYNSLKKINFYSDCRLWTGHFKRNPPIHNKMELSWGRLFKNRIDRHHGNLYNRARKIQEISKFWKIQKTGFLD